MGRVHYRNEQISEMYETLNELEQCLGWNLRVVCDPEIAAQDREEAELQINAALGAALVKANELQRTVHSLIDQCRRSANTNALTEGFPNLVSMQAEAPIDDGEVTIVIKATKRNPGNTRPEVTVLMDGNALVTPTDMEGF